MPRSLGRGQKLGRLELAARVAAALGSMPRKVEGRGGGRASSRLKQAGLLQVGPAEGKREAGSQRAARGIAVVVPGPLALAKANVDVAQYGGTAHFVAQAVVA